MITFELEPKTINVPGIKQAISIYRHSSAYHEKVIRPLLGELLTIYQAMEAESQKDSSNTKQLEKLNEQSKTLTIKVVLLYLHDQTYTVSNDDIDALKTCLGYPQITELYAHGVAINTDTHTLEAEAKKN